MAKRATKRKPDEAERIARTVYPEGTMTDAVLRNALARKIRRALNRAEKRATETVWRPMSEPPKNTRSVLVWIEPTGDPKLAFHTDCGWCDLSTYAVMAGNPEGHWCELPKPPAKKKGAKR